MGWQFQTSRSPLVLLTLLAIAPIYANIFIFTNTRGGQRPLIFREFPMQYQLRSGIPRIMLARFFLMNGLSKIFKTTSLDIKKCDLDLQIYATFSSQVCTGTLGS